MTPIEEVELFAWLFWNDDDDMWGIAAAIVPSIGVSPCVVLKEKNARRVKPLVSLMSRQSEKRARLVRFKFDAVLDEVGG